MIQFFLVNMITLAMTEKHITNPSVAGTSVHGVLLDIHGFGVLLVGPSGIGKSVNAAELLTRGHKLVSDDIVLIVKKESGRLSGKAPCNIKNLMEIADVGIINVNEIFGADSMLDQKEIDMVIELSETKPDRANYRLGIEEEHHELLGVLLPYKLITASSEVNTSVIIEIAVRNQMAKAINKSVGINKVQNL